MTSVEMKWLLRNLLADKAGDRWSDSELYLYLSMAQRRIAAEASIPTLWALTDIDVGMLVADQSAYALPSDFAYDRLVLYKGIESVRKSKDQIRELVDPNSHVTPSETNPFHVIENETIVFYVDAVTQTNGDTYELYYVRTPAEMTAVVEPELPLHFHNAIIDLAAALAYEAAGEPDRAEAQEAYGLEQIVHMNARYHGRDPYDDIARDPWLANLREE